MRYPESFLAELRARIDIEELVSKYTEIRHRGSHTPVALCPFHSEKTPSFVIYRDTQSYYCFGCGAGGDAVNFIRNIEHLDYSEAVRYLCEKAGMQMPDEQVDDTYAKIRRRCYEANREAARFFHSCLKSPSAAQAQAYLKKRALTPETVTKFGLGYAPDSWDELVRHLKSKGFTPQELVTYNLARTTKKGSVIDAFRNRLMFPIIDLRGNVCAFGGRVLDDSKPKYINTSDTPVYKKGQGIYALNTAKNDKDRVLILCEGYMDVIAMHQAGFGNAVAALGTAFTTEQVSMLCRYSDEILLSFDSDEAGQKATARALKMLSSAPVKVRVMHLENGKDPDEIIKTQGREKMQSIIDSALNDTEYVLNRAKSKYDVSTGDGKLGYLNEAVSVLAGIDNAIERDIYTTRLAGELGVERASIIAQTEKLMKRRDYRKVNEAFQKDADIAAGTDRILSHNPEKADNLRAVKAEETILANLLQNPDFYKKLSSRMSADTFVTQYNRRVYEDITDAIINNRSLDLAAFGDVSGNEEIAYLSYLLTLKDKIAGTLTECADCIEVLLSEKARKNLPDIGNMSDEDFLAAIKKKAEKK